METTLKKIQLLKKALTTLDEAVRMPVSPTGPYPVRRQP